MLFLFCSIHPSIANDVSIESDNSDLSKIIVHFYERDKYYNHTVILSENKIKELEYLRQSFKSKIDSTDDFTETESIFKNTIISLNEIGLLPKHVSINYAQNLVTGKGQKSLINSAFENIFCLISGESDKTYFAGPVPILLLIHYAIIISRINKILNWVSESSKFGELLSNIFKETFREIYQLRLYFWLYLAVQINLLPLKIGAFMLFGAIDFDPFYGGIIPSEGWINTVGLNGKKSYSGRFYGVAAGFTGIKIKRNDFDFFYFGTAIDVIISCE